jgi:DNA-binding IclR family transcriptional regulator
MAANDNEQPGTRRKKEYSAPALEKGLDIVEALAGASNGLTSKEISKRLGRPMGQLFRMLVVLQQRGYVEYRPNSERYELTLKLFELSHQLAPVRRLTLAAAPVMQRLSQEIKQSCHLVIYYSGKGHVVVQQDSPSQRILTVRLGAEAPLKDTCSGHVLLAFAEEVERQEMLDNIPEHHRRPSKKGLKEIVSRIRSNGFECIASAQIQGVQDIGYPVYEHSGRITAALVVPFLSYLDNSHPVKLKNAQKAIAESAGEISRRLGYQ